MSTAKKPEYRVRGIERALERQGCQFIKLPELGAPKAWLRSSLPHVTQAALMPTSSMPVGSKPAPLPVVSATIQPAKAPEQLKQWQRSIMDARVAIMRLIERAAPTVGVNKAINIIVKDSVDNPDMELYSTANARKGATRHLSYGGVIKWWMSWKKSGGNSMILAPKDTENYLEPAWAATFMKYWSKGQNPHLTDVLEEYYRSTGTARRAPSYGQARHYLEKIGKVQASKGRVTGKDLRALKPFRRRDTTQMYPGDAYTADGHCFDAEVYHPFTGRAFQPEVTPVLDVYSRKCVGWSVDLAESGLAVLDALRMACETHGIPAIFYTDNGSGYKNQMMTNPGTGILDRLAITPKYSRPRNPQAHGLSERGHQTILIKAAQQLCTYIGSKMDGDTAQIVFKKTRKAIDSGEKSPLMLEFDDFIKYINAAVAVYNNRPHRGLPALRDAISRKLVHQSPNQAWQLGLERMQRELPQDEWLVASGDQPDLYHPAVERTCIKGEIQFGKMSNGQPKRYFSHDLENWTGQRVQVAYCPSDPSRVWVRDLEHQRLLAVAELSANCSPYFAESETETARKKRGVGALKRLENHAEAKRLEMYGPQPVMVENPDRAKLELVRQQIEEADVQQAEIFTLPDTDRGKEFLWEELDAKVQAGEAIENSIARNFYRGWQSNEYHQSCQFVKEEMAANK
ncbi:MAG: DDE-type integrase/transposase/recombinase [Desulfuromonadaceae bacterium]|nr:DDE-type integrase/transposase/recombinase [Desulfuromonadaceae bacterium]